LPKSKKSNSKKIKNNQKGLKRLYFLIKNMKKQILLLSMLVVLLASVVNAQVVKENLNKPLASAEKGKDIDSLNPTTNLDKNKTLRNDSNSGGNNKTINPKVEIVKDFIEQKERIKQEFKEQIQEKISSNNTSAKEIAQQKNEELKQLRQNLTNQIKEQINLTKQTGILKIRGQQINISELNLTNKKIFVINDGEFKLIINSSGIKIENDTLKINNKEILLPREIEKKLEKKIYDINLKQETKNLLYKAKTKTNARFLGIIPVEMEEELEINAENGTVQKVNSPWWAIFAFK